MSPDQKWEELKRLTMLTLLEVAGGFGLRKLAYFSGDKRIDMLEYLMVGWVWIFDWTWHGNV